MSVSIFASWSRAFPKYLRKPLAATKFLNSSLPVSAMEFEDAGLQTRRLSDVSACAPPVATGWIARINNFLLNQAAGALFLNLIADVLVRCVLPLLSFCWFRRARSKNEKLKAEKLKKLISDATEESHKAVISRFLEAALNPRTQSAQASVSGHDIQSSSSDHAQSSGGGDISVSSASTSNAVKHIPKNGYPESPVSADSASTAPCDAKDILGILKTAPGTSPLIAYHASISEPSAEQVHERALKPDTRRRVNHVSKRRQASEVHFKVDGEETVTASTSSNDGDSHIIDMIPIQAVFPAGEVSSPTSLPRGDRVKRFFVVTLEVTVKEMFSSRILQARVATTARNLELLRDLAVEGMKVDKGFTLQIGEYYLYQCTGDPENPVLLSLRDVEVPTILQAEYVAGVLTVRGRFLEGAELRAATSEEYLILHPHKKEHTYPNGIEEWRCCSPTLMSDKPIHIFASKEVCIDKQYLTVRSEAFPMADNTLMTLMREWVPTTILTIFVLFNMYHLSVEVSRFIALLPLQELWLPYVGVALVMGILHTLPDRMEIIIGRTLYHINLAYLTLRLAPQALAYSSWKRKKVASQGTTLEDVSNDLKENLQKDVIKEKSTKKDATKPNQENEEENIDVKRLDWQWPKSKEGRSGAHYNLEDGTVIEQKKHECFQPFEVIYKPDMKRADDKSGSTNYLPKRIVIRVFSKSLRDILRSLLPQPLQDSGKFVEIQAEHLISLYLKDIMQGVLTSMDSGHSLTTKTHESSVPWLHLFHLIRFVKEEYGNIISQHQRMVAAGVISWDMLWTLMAVNEKVVFYCDASREELCGKVLSWCYLESATTRDPYGRDTSVSFEIDLEIWNYDCVSYRPHKIKRLIQIFSQESLISNLEVHPIKFETNVQDVEAFFLERGKRYHELVLTSERLYLQYKGFMFWEKGRSGFNSRAEYGRYRGSADGNVMIDQGAFSKMKSKRPMGTAQPPTGWSQGSWGLDKKKFPSESDENLQFSPAVVYGFSFSSRKWGCFLISRLNEITFNPTVFDKLVMAEQDSKEMLLAMTKYYLKKPVGDTETGIKEVEVDLVPNKGKGCIILLHGPPGTGKTFTVEALAEAMECPLWQLTVSTRNKKPKQLETKLLKIFEVAALWGAILLLDEADVYLSSRKYSPLATHASQGNARTSVFLRVLEYYQGILFLTTNQPECFEPAIDSRISLSIQYKNFDICQRRQLWSTFMKRVGLANASPAFWKEILGEPVNGRVIRNIVSSAKIYSISKEMNLNEGHILFAFRVRIPTLRDAEEEKPESRDGGAESVSAVLSYISHHDDDSITG